MRRPLILIQPIEQLIEQQISTYYPNRLADYLSGSLMIHITLIQNKADTAFFLRKKEESSITDKNCVIIVGFNEARLFLRVGGL